MARNTEALVLELTADLRRAEQNMAKMVNIADKRLTQVEKRAMQSDKNLSRIMGSAGRNMTESFRNGLRDLAPILAGVFSANAVKGYADTYTQLNNRLRVTGLEGAALADQYRELDRVATQSRSSLEATVELYSRIAIASRALGVSTNEVTRVTETLSKAMAASGASASETASAMLQFGQAIGSGVLQGDELRSLRENAPLIAQAIAEEFNTTIGGLKKLGEEGQLTSARVLQAVLKAGNDIDAMFSKTQGTIANAITYFNNQFITYVGESDKVVGASELMANAIRAVADNLEILTTAAGVFISIIGARYLIAIGSAIASTTLFKDVMFASRAAMTGAATTAGAASFAFRSLGASMLAAFGGPIGLAITGVAVALSFVAVEAAKNAATQKQLEDRYLKTDKAQKEASKSAEIVAKASEKVRSVASDEEIVVASLTGEVGLLEDANYRLAASYKAREVAALRARAAETSADVASAEKNYRGVVDRARAAGISPTGGGATIGSASIPMETARDRQTAQQIAQQSKEYKVLTEAKKENKAVTEELAAAESRSLKDIKKELDSVRGSSTGASSASNKAARDRQAEMRQRLENERRLAEIRATGDAKAIQAEEDRQRLAELTASYTEAGYEDAIERAKELFGYEVRIRDATERKAKFDAKSANAMDRLSQKADAVLKAEQQRADLAQDTLEYERRLAELRGDTKTAKARERELEILRRTKELRDMGVSNPEQRAIGEVDTLISAEAYSDMRDKFGSAFSEGIRAAMSGDLQSFFENMVGSATERALQNYGKKLFDDLGLGDLFGLDEAANAGTETALAQVAILQPAFATASLEMATAITTAGSAAAAAMAAAISGASLGSSLASLPSFAGGGYTGNSARSGGLDGKGGFLAMMHPQENVTDLTRNMPDPSRMLSANGGGPIDVRVRIDDDGGLQAYVERTSYGAARAMGSQAVRASVERSARQMKSNLPAMMKKQSKGLKL